VATEQTFTAPLTDERLGASVQDVLALTIALHFEPALVGRQRLLVRDAPLVVGRKGLAFGEGALEDQGLSRDHFEVALRGGSAVVRDLGSRNGIAVNGERVRERALRPGDVVAAGRLLFLLHHTRPGPGFASNPVLLGQSAALGDVLRQIAQVAPRDTTALVLGETGVGKELVAREIHRQSGRCGRFVAVNCGGLADGVLQSELFGHRKGAFSGAGGAREGLVAAAAGGTLFLDEVGDASPTLQVALLRLLQDREYRPVGADQVLRSDARFVAATHQPLEAEIEGGGFRRDLWARLSRWVISVPPLRDRMEDLPPLVTAFTHRHAGRSLSPSRSLMTALLGHRWPGNVRELDAVVERLVVACGDGEQLELDPAVASLLGDEPEAAAEGQVAARQSSAPRARPDADALVAVARAAGGNLRQAATRLGVARSTYYRWLREAGLDPAEVRDR